MKGGIKMMWYRLLFLLAFGCGLLAVFGGAMYNRIRWLAFGFLLLYMLLFIVTKGYKFLDYKEPENPNELYT